MPDIPDLHVIENRSPRWLKFLFGVIVVLVLFLMSARSWVTYLWFVQDLGKPRVFTLGYSVGSVLWVSSFVLCWFVFRFAWKKAAEIQLVYVAEPGGFVSIQASKALGIFQQMAPRIVHIVAVLMAFIFATSASGHWRDYLLWKNATPFGRTEPLFGHDLGFYVFTLPWYQFLVDFLLSTMFVALIGALVIIFGISALAGAAKAELPKPKARNQIAKLGSVVIILFGLSKYLGVYELVRADNGQFVGAGFAQSSTLWAEYASIALIVLDGFWILSSVVRDKLSRRFMISQAWAVGLIVALQFVAPTAQRFLVEPNKITVEAPYAQRALSLTRFGYGLEVIDSKDLTVHDAPTQQEIDASATTLDNMRLWDPEILRHSLEGIQGLRPYYHFSDVDVDRYVIDGRARTVMVGPRDVYLPGLSTDAQAWLNTRLQYTHGYGVAMAEVNSSDSSGLPSLLVRDMPVQTTKDIPITRPQIYFSDAKERDGERVDSYALVKTGVKEFDYPSQQGMGGETKWEGDRGIHVGEPLVRLLASVDLQDGNLLVSGNVRPESRLLIHRNVYERAATAYPFLKLDNDPYMVVAGGKLVWILDAYATTDKVPYSVPVMLATGEVVNYIRNSVKITIDAYTGEMHGYVVDASDPLTRAYRSIYPELFEDLSAMPTDLKAHMRYPDELMNAQAAVLTTYHVTDPTSFLVGNDAWSIPFEKGLDGNRTLMRPYFVQMRLPSEAKDEFLSILPFTPRLKTNLSGWLAAHCDPADYGKLALYKFARGSLVPGPEQMEAFFNQDRAVADVNRQLTNDQSQITTGNMLVIPIGNSMMFVEPMFLQSRSQGIAAVPELKKVVLGLKDKVVIGDSYEEALRKLFGDKTQERPSQAASSTSGPKGAVQVPSDLSKQALDTFKKAEQALKDGDFATYGKLQKELRAQLEKLASGERPAKGPGK